MYLKCLSNAAILPTALRNTLKRQELLAKGSEFLLTCTPMHVHVEEHTARNGDRSPEPGVLTRSYRPSRMNASTKDRGEKSKSVRFTTSSLPPTSKSWLHDDGEDSATSVDLLDERAEEATTTTISTIKSLLQ